MRSLIRKATKQDLERLRVFLTSANLGTEGLSEETVECFLLIEDVNGAVKGTVGMEIFNEYAVLRSLVVSSGQAEQEIVVLLDQMVKLAKEKGSKNLFLATNKRGAMPFFELMGFQPVDGEKLPEEFSESDHIQQIVNVDNPLFLRTSL